MVAALGGTLASAGLGAGAAVGVGTASASLAGAGLNTFIGSFDEERKDYIIGIQIPYNSTITSSDGELYTARNFFMPTGFGKHGLERHPSITLYQPVLTSTLIMLSLAYRALSRRWTSRMMQVRPCTTSTCYSHQ